MQLLEQLQNKFDSMQKLHSIVSTMKSLSAASIRQFESGERAATDYFDTVVRGFAILLQHDVFGERTQSSGTTTCRGVIVLSSDYGLCGQFNEVVVERALTSISADPREHLIVTVGARGAALLERQNVTVLDVLRSPSTTESMPDTVKHLVQLISRWRSEFDVGEVDVFYNSSASGEQLRPQQNSLLPIDPRLLQRLRQTQWPSRCQPQFTMPPKTLRSALIQQYLFVVLLRALARSTASEHASRLARMQYAQHNLEQGIDQVRTELHRARQELITAQLLDISSGYECLMHD